MGGMTRIGPTSGEVLVIRSGYASDALWLAAIRSALAHGRAVRSIDATGHEREAAAEGSAHEEGEGGAVHAIAVTSAPSLASRRSRLQIQPGAVLHRSSPLRLVLPRAVAERLTARALRENHPSLAALVQAVLEREGKG